MTKHTVIEQPFTTEFGTVVVGDYVVALLTDSKNAKLRRAKYLGYIESISKNGAVIKKVKLEVQDYRYVWYYKQSDTKWDWYQHDYSEVKNDIESREVPYTRTTVLKLNRIAPIKDNDNFIIQQSKNLV